MKSKLIAKKTKKTQKVNKKQLNKLKSKKKKVIGKYQKGGANASLTITLTDNDPFYAMNNTPLVIDYEKRNTAALAAAIIKKYLTEFRIRKYVDSDSLKVSAYNFFTALFEKQEKEVSDIRHNLAMNIACFIGSKNHYAIGLVDADIEPIEDNSDLILTIVMDEKAPIHRKPVTGQKSQTEIKIRYTPEYFKKEIANNKDGLLETVCRIIESVPPATGYDEHMYARFSILQSKKVGDFFKSSIEKAYAHLTDKEKNGEHLFVQRQAIADGIQACVNKHVTKNEQAPEKPGNSSEHNLENASVTTAPPRPQNSSKPSNTPQPATATGEEPHQLSPKPTDQHINAQGNEPPPIPPRLPQPTT